ncbi:hypothetical protein BHE74_00052026 [Ensete ventricosum]|nr:hypothetical protein BHE74_00052026 [Ensete ventricosum]
MHRVDAVGNSPGMHWKLAKGIRSLLGWPKGVHQKKSKTRRKIVEGSDDAVGSHRKFTRRFAERIEKLARNAKGDCQEEDRRTSHKIAGGCRIMHKLGLL